MLIAADAALRAARRVPSATRLYWVCQFAGWGGFALYIGGSYLIFASPREGRVLLSMLLFNALVCPAVTHGLRHWMYRRGWHDLPVRRLVRSAAGAVPVVAAVLTVLVAGLDAAIDGSFDIGRVGGAWTLAAFTGAVGGWMWTYWVVHARRRRDRVELELTVLAREAQLRSIRAQVNPHFLFNCLNSIRGLIQQDPARAETMVTALADLLRYALTADRRQMVPLADELEVVEQYLALETIRFEERLMIERHVASETLQVPIPPMIVQTLVENAVKHGISQRQDGGVVRLESRAIEGRLLVIVTNSGRLPTRSGGGFGLRNAEEQLRILYGERASLTLSADGDRTTATVTVPIP
jgi:anti-sigma regulatory factor (Ser/Thr protein kinase)